MNSSIVGDYKELVIERKNIEAVNIEETIPTWHIPFKYLVINNSKNWEEVNDWALRVFELENEPVLDETLC